jgi:hypothetical protein
LIGNNGAKRYAQRRENFHISGSPWHTVLFGVPIFGAFESAIGHDAPLTVLDGVLVLYIVYHYQTRIHKLSINLPTAC